MIIREQYLNEILKYKNTDYIKVITGVRRAGKSELLKMLSAKLKKSLLIDFDDMEFLSITNVDGLLNLLKAKQYKKYSALLFDEIQNIDGWERVINSIAKTGKIDIYITGSNSKLLSSELSTHLTGRTIQFEINTLTYQEFLLFKEGGTFEEFVEYGGFPSIYSNNLDLDNSKQVVQDLYDAAMLRDVIDRHKILKPNLLKIITKYITQNVGNIFSAKSISDYLKSEKISLKVDTVLEYLEYLSEAYLIHKVNRSDIGGKKIFKIDQKYYVADHSLITANTSNYQKYISGILENIVFHQLKFMDYKEITVGKVNDAEVDFVATKISDERMFIQVSYLMESDDTFAREIEPLKNIKSAHRKIILTLDKTRIGNYDGIEVIYLPEWLISQGL